MIYSQQTNTRQATTDLLALCDDTDYTYSVHASTTVQT